MKDTNITYFNGKGLNKVVEKRMATDPGYKKLVENKKRSNERYTPAQF